MMQLVLILACLLPASLAAQEMHNHPAPEKLGTVSFATSCKPGTEQEFNRAVALLHSFAYKIAEEAFQSVAEQDPQCAIAHWGIAMTHYHELWEPVLPPLALWPRSRKSGGPQCSKKLQNASAVSSTHSA